MVHRVATAQELLHAKNSEHADRTGHNTGEKVMTSPEIRGELFDLERIFFLSFKKNRMFREESYAEGKLEGGYYQ